MPRQMHAAQDADKIGYKQPRKKHNFKKESQEILRGCQRAVRI